MNGSIMAPAGSLAASDYQKEQERLARERGFYGLLTSMADPISMMPGPVGVAAQAAGNVGREGWKQGLMQTASELVLPRVLRKGPSKLSTVKRATPREEALLAQLKGKALDEAMDEMGLFRALDARPVREIPAYQAKLTPRAERELTRYRTVEGSLSDLWDFPEFFERTPTAKGTYTRLTQVPRGKDTPAIRGHFEPGPQGERASKGKIFVASSSPPGSPYDLLGGLAHEGTHLTQVVDQRTYGSSPSWIRQNIEHHYGKDLPKDPTIRAEVLERLGKVLYGLNLGEREAFGSQRRRFLSPEGLKARPFNEDVLLVGQLGGDQLPVTADQLIRTPPWGSAAASWPSYVPKFQEYLAKILAEKGLRP